MGITTISVKSLNILRHFIVVTTVLTDGSTTVDSKTIEIGVHLKQAVIDFFIAEGEKLIFVYERFLRIYGDATEGAELSDKPQSGNLYGSDT